MAQSYQNAGNDRMMTTTRDATGMPMSTDTTVTVPNRRLILQYALFLVGAMVLVFAMVWALEAYAGVTVDGGSSGLVVPMVAASAIPAMIGATMRTLRNADRKPVSASIPMLPSDE